MADKFWDRMVDDVVVTMYPSLFRKVLGAFGLLLIFGGVAAFVLAFVLSHYWLLAFGWLVGVVGLGVASKVTTNHWWSF